MAEIKVSLPILCYNVMHRSAGFNIDDRVNLSAECLAYTLLDTY
jgi:hypothetical protein